VAGGDLGAHRAGRESHTGQVVQVEAVQRGGPGCAEVGHHGGHVGEYQQLVGVDGDGEQGHGEVLVDDGLDALEQARAVIDDRGSAAAPADDHRLVLQQMCDRSLLDDPLWVRGGDDTTPPVAVGGDVPTVRLGQPQRALMVVDGSDELRGCGEGRVVRVDQCLGDDTQDRLRHSGVVQALGQPVADHPLCLGDERVQWVGAGQGQVVLALQGEHADLRAVAVADEQLVVRGERGEGPGGRLDVLDLDDGVGLLAASQECVAAERGHDAHVSRLSRRGL